MFKTFIIGFSMYLWGSPSFETIRPEFASLHLENFHKEINVVVDDMVRTTDVMRHLNQFPAIRDALRNI